MRTSSSKAIRFPESSRVSHMARPMYSIERDPAMPPKVIGEESFRIEEGSTSVKVLVAE